jgi:hypothetical protein
MAGGARLVLVAELPLMPVVMLDQWPAQSLLQVRQLPAKGM